MAVSRDLFSSDFPSFPERSELRGYLTANGRSFSQLKLLEEREDARASRRVEFKFRLKDEDAVKRVQEILTGRAVGP